MILRAHEFNLRKNALAESAWGNWHAERTSHPRQMPRFTHRPAAIPRRPVIQTTAAPTLSKPQRKTARKNSRRFPPDSSKSLIAEKLILCKSTVAEGEKTGYIRIGKSWLFFVIAIANFAWSGDLPLLGHRNCCLQ